MKEAKATKVTTGKFRVSFPSVFQPRSANPQDPNATPKYSITMLFKKTDDLAALKAACKAAGIEKWGADTAKWPKPKGGLMLPFRDGTEKDFDGYGADVIFVQASSKQRPGVVDEAVQPIMEPSEFYGGCYARATLNAFAWEFMGKAGISFGLNNVQKMGDGEPFGNKSKPENDFDSIETPAAAGAPKADDTGLGL